jgi:hypothetical protein
MDSGGMFKMKSGSLGEGGYPEWIQDFRSVGILAIRSSSGTSGFNPPPRLNRPAFLRKHHAIV